MHHGDDDVFQIFSCEGAAQQVLMSVRSSVHVSVHMWSNGQNACRMFQNSCKMF